MTATTTNGKPDAAPKRSAPPEHAVQNNWYARNAGKEIRLRLMDGSVLAGVLTAWDTYTLALAVAGREDLLLVMKHGIVLCMRTEERDRDRGRSATRTPA
jgi:sRNA-binding regulator protein Hfq